MNYKIILRYDGTRYNGWQKQGNTENTIQGRLEQLLSRLTGDTVEIHGAGRTDAGVHALGQVANAHVTTALDETALKEAINQYLPEDIEVISLEKVNGRFHSRLNAVRKTYAYRIALDEQKHIFERKYLYLYGKQLDTAAMEMAAKELCGSHDFRSFCANKKMKKSTVRILEEIAFQEQDGILTIRFTGNGFLYHMVRILVGTLIEVGEGKRSPASMAEILEAKNRERSGFCAPAQGLFLVSVDYGENL